MVNVNNGRPFYALFLFPCRFRSRLFHFRQFNIYKYLVEPPPQPHGRRMHICTFNSSISRNDVCAVDCAFGCGWHGGDGDGDWSAVVSINEEMRNEKQTLRCDEQIIFSPDIHRWTKASTYNLKAASVWHRRTFITRCSERAWSQTKAIVQSNQAFSWFGGKRRRWNGMFIARGTFIFQTTHLRLLPQK